MYFNYKNNYDDKNIDNEYVKRKYQQEIGCEMIRWSLFNSTKVKKILVTYTDLVSKKNEIEVNRDAFGEKFISVYFLFSENFEINYPQQITLKFITDEALYIVETELKDIIREKNLIYFTIKAPAQMERRQRRAYYRLELTKNVIVVAHDLTQSDGISMMLGKIINLSASGAKIGNVEPLFYSDNYEEQSNVKLSLYKNFHVILILNSKTLVRLKASFVRYEKSKAGQSYYCLKFEEQRLKDIDIISKFIIVEQINKNKLEKAAKTQFKDSMRKKGLR